MDTLYTFIVLPTIKLKVYTFWGLMNSSTKKILDDFLIFHHPTPAGASASTTVLRIVATFRLRV